jgi:hypothetical protein
VKKRHIATLLALIPFALAIPTAQALEAHRIGAGESFKLDGRLDEAFWSKAQSMKDFYDWIPRDNTPSAYPTEIKVAFDGQKLYVGIVARDPDPSLVRAPFVRRDKVLGDQDFIAVLIDPVGSKKFAQFFRVSAQGVLADGLFNDANTEEDFSPDFDYEGAAHRTDFGWTAELAIPFSSLRYSNPPPEQWNILAFRGTTRDQLHRAANVRIPRDWNCLVCYAEPLTGLKSLPDTTHLSVVPQFTAASRTDQVKGEPEKRKNEFKAGVDIKFRPRPETVVDATINPDFSQVELDTPQLAGNSQFALFFPEKRPFFLEGADLLESPMRVIYTRSITDPSWGARVTQRTEGFDFTMLTTKDDGKGLVLLPGPLGTGFASQDFKSQATLGRFKLHNGAWSAGGVLTDRTLEGGAYNRVIGADFGWRPNELHRIRAQLVQSWTTAQPDADGKLVEGPSRNDHAALMDWVYNDPKYYAYVQLEDIGRDFRADNGFFSQTGYRKVFNELRYKFGTPFGFNEFNLFLVSERKLDEEGRVLYQQYNPGIFMSGARATNITIEYRPNQKVRVANEGTPLKRDQFYASVESQPFNWLPYVYAEVATGDRVDVVNNRTGKGTYIGANARLRPHNRIEIEPRIDDAWVDSRENVEGNKRIIHERAMQIVGIYHVTAQDSARVIWQRGFVRRSPSLYTSAVQPIERNQTVSLVYAHRRSLNATVYLGATVGRVQEPDSGFQRDQKEIFAKVSWPIGWL